jgi:hypothetical protein
MTTPHGLQANKEIAPDQQAYWGDKNEQIISQSFAYIKSLALEKGINIYQTKSGYLVSQWSMARHTNSLKELVRLLKKMGLKI